MVAGSAAKGPWAPAPLACERGQASVQAPLLELQRVCAERTPSLAEEALRQLLRALEDRSMPVMETIPSLIARWTPRVPESQLRLPPFGALPAASAQSAVAGGILQAAGAAA